MVINPKFRELIETKLKLAADCERAGDLSAMLTWLEEAEHDLASRAQDLRRVGVRDVNSI